MTDRTVYFVDVGAMPKEDVEAYLKNVRDNFLNNSTNTFSDISSEEFRIYRFANGEEVRIDYPVFLSVSTSGHRLYDAAGISHYVPKGWIHLKWRPRDGKANFVK